ncbi:MAG: phosphopyruvate hydratase [Eubacteriales bacterium]|nr:phosphopyruvate hydratase [Eubacteriales bacterium]MDD3881266.1 phosphopyruvate hydratase [Eubacteriales bacterium]MDD4512184.1 phosphopyruvate hydratase [Eubacteriales bacterium]
MEKFQIKDVSAIQILDSRGVPTVRAYVTLEGGIRASASVPSGASTGSFEAHEKRDGDMSEYGGSGVKKAVRMIEDEISPAVCGADIRRLREIDETMRALDGTDEKRRLGANAILAVSLAAARASAEAQGLPLYYLIGGENARTLPMPMMNILNGGRHADNGLDIQEFMIQPRGARSFEEAVKMGAEVYMKLKGILKQRNLSTAVGDEGGFAPDVSTEEAIEMISEAVIKAGYTGSSIPLCLDAAASEWQHEGRYLLPKAKKSYEREELIEYWLSLCSRFPIASIEDPLGENDFEGFAAITRERPSIQWVGDDLFVTNPERLRRGIRQGAANALLCKMNQIGTLSETLGAISLAKENGYAVIVSHRSGETADTFLSDLAVAVNASQVKTGAPCRAERTEKYNRLIEIEKELGIKGIYGGLLG